VHKVKKSTRTITHSIQTQKEVDLRISRALTAMLITAYLKGDAHVVSCIGTIQILCNILAKKFDPRIDNLVISKGHAALGLYSVLLEFGVITSNEFSSFREESSNLGIHVSSGFESYSRLSSGSLGHGIGFGAGISLSKKIQKKPGNVYVIAGDGEMNEGSNYEALQIAANQELDNLILIVDHNEVQSVAKYSEISSELRISDKITSFGWSVKEAGIRNKLNMNDFNIDSVKEVPKGLVYFSNRYPVIPEMQNQVLWHYRRPDIEDLKKGLLRLNSYSIAPDYVNWLEKK